MSAVVAVLLMKNESTEVPNINPSNNIRGRGPVVTRIRSATRSCKLHASTATARTIEPKKRTLLS